MKKLLIVIFSLCLVVTSVSAYQPEDVIDLTLEYMRTNFVFGTEGYKVEAIEYTLSDVRDYGEGIILMYDIKDRDSELKTQVGFHVNPENLVIKGVLFDNRYSVFSNR